MEVASNPAVPTFFAYSFLSSCKRKKAGTAGYEASMEANLSLMASQTLLVHHFLYAWRHHNSFCCNNSCDR